MFVKIEIWCLAVKAVSEVSIKPQLSRFCCKTFAAFTGSHMWLVWGFISGILYEERTSDLHLLIHYLFFN